jgi:hypothetical protein
MASGAYITNVSLRYRFIVFSFTNDYPIDISPYVIDVSGSKSNTDSASEAFVFSIKSSIAALSFQIGDWLQIDLEAVGEKPEHLFFGQITAIEGDETLVGVGGGIGEVVSVQTITWGSIFLRFIRDLQTYLRTNADTLFPWREKAPSGGAPGFEPPPPGYENTAPQPKLVDLEEPEWETPPSLATIAQGRLKAHSWQAVAIVLHYLCRYGGTFGQQFWMPRSYTGLNELAPIIEFVARVNRTRLPRDEVLDDTWPGFDDDVNNIIRQIEKRDREGGTFDTNVPEGKRVWPYSDWHRVLTQNRSFVAGAGFMRDFLTYDLQTTLFDLATDLSDPAFNELFFALQERCSLAPQTPNQAIDAVTQEKVSFDRAFAMTVVLRPIPHPSWDTKSNTKIKESKSGLLMFTADRTNYRALCPKFVLSIGHNARATFQQSMNNVFTYFNVLPQDSEMKAMELFDAGAMLRFSSGRVPIIDDDLMQTFGHMPMVPKTRYYIGSGGYYVSPTSGPSEFVQVEDTLNLPNPTGEGYVRFRLDQTPFWMILASKTLAMYAWHARGYEFYTGVVNMPIVHPNVPRPGDVGYLVAHGEDRSAHFRLASRDIMLPKHLASEMSSGAISIYIDSVDYRLRVDPKTSIVSGDLIIHYSHGVWCETPKPNPQILPYHRFVDYTEAGIDPTYFLPASTGAVRMRDELFTEYAQVEVVTAAELVKEIEGEKDDSRKKKRRKRARRRRRKIGIRTMGAAKSGATTKLINFTLKDLDEYEPEEETKKTKRNPAKKAAKVKNVPQYLTYKVKREDLGGTRWIEHQTRLPDLKRKGVDQVVIDVGKIED